MTSIVFPAIPAPSSASWRLRATTQTHTSPFDGTTQTLALPAARWEASLAWQTLTVAQYRTLSAWLAGLQGQAGRFRFGPYQSHLSRLAVGGGVPVVNGAGQSGATLSIRGFAANADAFRAGDFLSYLDTSGRARLHQVTADVTASAGGIAAVSITPPIRRAGADGVAVEIAAPFGFFRMTEDAQDIAVRPGPFASVSLEMTEALA
jgi:hypothetical protein